MILHWLFILIFNHSKYSLIRQKIQIFLLKSPKNPIRVRYFSTDPRHPPERRRTNRRVIEKQHLRHIWAKTRRRCAIGDCKTLFLHTSTLNRPFLAGGVRRKPFHATSATHRKRDEPTAVSFLSVTAVTSEDTSVDDTENTTEAPPRRAPQKRRARWRREEM